MAIHLPLTGVAATPEQTGPARLSLRNVSKSFGGIRALDDVSFDIRPGEIHALVGENGAGKSTLVKIITGYQEADEGAVMLDGESVGFKTPMEAYTAGVVAVYQDPKVFPQLNVAENVFMGLYPRTRYGLVDRRTMYTRVRELLGELEVDLDPAAMVAGLSVAELQFVEIARALAQKSARVLILDEPTASLTPSETDRLFRIVRHLRDGGTSVVFISHRLEEIIGLVDTVTVLRDGKHVGTVPADQIDEGGIIRMMVGRSLDALYAGAARQDAAPPDADAAPALRVVGLSLRGRFEDISFSLHRGEVLGVAGLVGAGRTEIAQALFGITPPTSGQVFVNGTRVQVRNPRQMLRHGLAYLPEDRDTHGLITQFSISNNIVLPLIGRLSRLGVLQPRRERAKASELATELQVRAKGIDQIVASLSGGNRQKVVIGKWLGIQPAILILDEPTHGIDVATKAQVHQVIRHLADGGVAILMISSDLPEILSVSDRIIVIADGRLTAALTRADATQESIMVAATGHRLGEDQ